MRTIRRKFLIIIIFLFGMLDIFSAPSPPSPGAKKPPPPPGLPIDENLYIVFILSIMFGIYIIYKNQLKTLLKSYIQKNIYC